MTDDFKRMEREAHNAAVDIADRAFALGRAAERIAGELQRQMDGAELHPTQAADRLAAAHYGSRSGIGYTLTALDAMLKQWEATLPNAAALTASAADTETE